MAKWRGNATVTYTFDVNDIEVEADNEKEAVAAIEEIASETPVFAEELDWQDTEACDVELDDEEEETENDDDEESDASSS